MQRPTGPDRFVIPGFVLDESSKKSGASGEVFKAHEKLSGGPLFAVKIFHPSAFVSREDARKRFLKEINLLRKVQHSSIVRYALAGLTEDEHEAPFLVMDFIDGAHLRDLRPEMPFDDKIGAVLEVLDALTYLHGRGIFHRDVKPTNIMRRNSDNKTVLIDFGVAFLWGDQLETGHTLTRGTIGTPGYIPFEAVEDPKKSRSARFDVYSTGISLYELVAGQLPSSENYQPLRNRDPKLSGLDQVVQRAIASESERFASTCEFAEQLRIWHKRYRVRIESRPSPLLTHVVQGFVKQDEQEATSRRKIAEREQKIRDKLQDLDSILAPLISKACEEFVSTLQGIRNLTFINNDIAPLSGVQNSEPICAIKNLANNDMICFARSTRPGRPLLGSSARDEPVIKWPDRDQNGRPLEKPKLAQLCWIIYCNTPILRGGIGTVVNLNQQLDVYTGHRTDPPTKINPEMDTKDYITKMLAGYFGLRNM